MKIKKEHWWVKNDKNLPQWWVDHKDQATLLEDYSEIKRKIIEFENKFGTPTSDLILDIIFDVDPVI